MFQTRIYQLVLLKQYGFSAVGAIAAVLLLPAAALMFEVVKTVVKIVRS